MSKKLFVGNLSYDVSQEQLQQFFSEAGQVVSVRVISDRMTGRSKGFGFVEMSTDEEGKVAIRDLDGREVAGRAIRITEAREPGEDGGFPRRSGGAGDRGGFGGGGFGGGGFGDRGGFGGDRGGGFGDRRGGPGGARPPRSDRRGGY